MLLKYLTLAVVKENVVPFQDHKEWTAWARYLIATLLLPSLAWKVELMSGMLL